MIKVLFILSFIILGNTSIGQTTITIKWRSAADAFSGDSIFYRKDKKLKWTDFKGVPDKKSFAAAVTESGFGYRLFMRNTNGKTNIIVTVECYFNKSKSWVKPDMKLDYALNHEQNHFDITYINTCLFLKKIRESNFTKENVASLLEMIHDESMAALEKMQNDYDGETKNGRIKALQEFWDKKIIDLLAASSTD